jgi:hypothetical protein
MKFGVREICDVVLRAKTAMKVGGKQFYKNEPVLYFDTLTTSSLEGSATTSYAQGGKGNTRLMAWEGERTLTFNMTDALISPESFSVLSGADIYDAAEVDMYVHTTARAVADDDYCIKVPGLACWNHKASLATVAASSSSVPTTSTGNGAGQDFYNAGADIFIMGLKNGEVDSEPAIPAEATAEKPAIKYTLENGEYFSYIRCYDIIPGQTALVDYYVKQTKGKQIEITPDKFGGYFYLEASTLFRDEATGKDMPAEFVIPNCKIQSNFTFSMSSTGDPSTFDFVLDAFPDYTKFDQTKKVLAVVQVVEDADEVGQGAEGQRAHTGPDDAATSTSDSSEFDHKNFYGFNAAITADKYAEDEDEIASEGRHKSDT